MRPGRADNCVQRFDERGPTLKQLFQPQTGKRRKLSVPGWRHFNHYFAAIGSAMRPSQHLQFFEPVDPFDGRVVADLQPLSDCADRGRSARRHSNDRKNHLVLFRLKPGGAHRVIGSIQKQPDAIAKFSQGLIAVLLIVSHA
jgi:hypothetical protein